MNGKFFVRLLGVAACVGAFATSNEAEAGRWHRRHRSEPVCCEPVCCEPVCCEPVCCEPVCELVASYDNCGRIVYRQPVCCETIVSSRIVVPATRCCDIAGTGSVDAGSVATTPAQESLAATTASVVK